MTAADLIQILMRDENIDKEMVVTNVRDNQEFSIEESKDFGAFIELRVDLGEPEDNDCMCDCDSCWECERQ